LSLCALVVMKKNRVKPLPEGGQYVLEVSL